MYSDENEQQPFIYQYISLVLKMQMQRKRQTYLGFYSEGIFSRIPWTRDLCSLADLSHENFFSHNVQSTCCGSMCILLWQRTCFCVRNILSQRSHLWFFIPVWIDMCIIRSLLSMKVLLQYMQDSDFIPKWVFMWRLIAFLLAIDLLHWEQL